MIIRIISLVLVFMAFTPCMGEIYQWTDTRGINVNLAMVTAGMAELYRGNSVKGLDMDPYRRAQDEAKRAYRGIWSLGPSYQSPKSWRKAHPRK